HGGRLTTYLMDIGVTATEPSREAAWRAAGHEIGPHIVTPGLESMRLMLTACRQLMTRASRAPHLRALCRPGRRHRGPRVPRYMGGVLKQAALQVALQHHLGLVRERFKREVRTLRNHTIDWVGWSEMAAIAGRQGIRLDTNYYHYAPWLV